MALQLVEPAAEVYSTYERSVLDFLGAQALATEVYHLPVGSLGLAELAGGATLAEVVASGCRFFASWPDATWTSSEMTDPTLYGNAEFRNFATGEFAAAAVRRIAEARAVSAVQSGDYELHFLSVPGIYLEALHLVSRGAGPDLVLPLVSPDPRLGADGVFEEAEFLAIARADAAARAARASDDPLSS